MSALNSREKMISEQQIRKLLAGYYILPRGRRLCLFSPQGSPEEYMSRGGYNAIAYLLKIDKRRRQTLHLGKVRSLHGNTLIKRIYKGKEVIQKGKPPPDHQSGPPCLSCFPHALLTINNE